MDAEFWRMGGYATFVWGSYATGVAILAWNLWSARSAMRRLRRRLADAAGDR